MPYYSVVWDGMGFTRRESRTEDDLPEAQAKRYSNKLRKAGALPRGVVAVQRATVSPDGKEDGEWKVFVSIELVVEAANIEVAERMEVPEEFLLMVADKMVRADADMTYGLRGSFEVLSADDSDYVPEKMRKVSKKLSGSASGTPVVNPHVV